MSDPIIKVKRLAYVRVSAPDPTKAEAFLREFGLQVAARTEAAVYLRGTDPDPPCYVLTRGASGVTARHERALARRLSGEEQPENYSCTSLTPCPRP